MEDKSYKVQGFQASAVASGLKKDDEQDLMLIYSERETAAAGVFTTNQVQAAPVVVTREHVAAGNARAIIANAGNANACTGEAGIRDSRRTAGLVAEALGLAENQVLVASTGVIGLPLDMNKVEKAVPRLVNGLSPDGFTRAAQAIMTTDSFAKLSMAEGRAGGRPYRIVGMAKGAGMIMPNMATMLSFILTDIGIGRFALQEVTAAAADRTFNRITVDGDTSTNDTVLVLANGAAGNGPLEEGDVLAFAGHLERVMGELARMIVKDGEGATKLVEVEVGGAASRSDALTGARTVANSSLVKTAMYGQDPNWGRIIAALGRSGIRMSPECVDIRIGQVPIVSGGVSLGQEAEKKAAVVMAGGAYTIAIDLHQGAFQDRVTTCDLTHDYVSINANYRT